MEPIMLYSALKRSTSPVQEREVHSRVTAASTANMRHREDEQEGGTDTVVVRIGSSPPPHAARVHDGQRHARTADASVPAARPVAIPPPPGSTAAAGSSSLSPLPDDGLDSDNSEAATATQHLTAEVRPATSTTTATAAVSSMRLSNSPVDVPPSAVPASRFQNIYDGSLYLPPGMTKRALGRLQLVWCCVLTQESWHASFVAAPILLFTVLFVEVVVPPGEWFSYLFTLVFTVASLTCLTLAVTMDPGVVPPAPLSELPPGPATVMVDGKMVECKVCKTCHILRPPRSSHCKFCDVCVEEFDHHCGVLGSCVAKRTFRFFGGFFIVTTFLALFVGVRSFMIVISTDFTNGNEDMHVLAIAAGSVVCIFAAFLGAVMVVPCAVRYIMLSAMNETTKETMQREQQQQRDANQLPGCVPVEEIRGDGYCKNLVRRLFSPLGRSRIPFDYYV